MDTDIAPLNIPDGELENWQELADLLAALSGVPAALIMRYVEPEIQVYVASKSDGNPYRPGEREHLESSGLYCETVIKDKKKLLVPDALADDAWKNNPDVALNMISYLGFPILLPDGKPFGTLCILDNKPNAYSALVEKLMLKFKHIIEHSLALLYMNQQLGDQNKALTDYLDELQALRGIVNICAYCKAIRDDAGAWRPIDRYLTKHPAVQFSHGVCPTCLEIIERDGQG